MKILLTAFVVATLASQAFAGLRLPAETLEAAPLEKEAPFDGDNPEIDYNGLQLEKKGSAEMEVDDMRDAGFDDEVCDESGRPDKPRDGEIEGLYEKQKDSIAAEAKAGGIDVNQVSLSLQPFSPYFTDKLSWKPKLKCCPAVWKYGCKSTHQRMPCFRNYHNNQREWCCPLWPGVYIQRCLCDKCHIMTKSCVHQGRCIKRYSRRNFLAVCYRGGWGYLRYFSKWLPSSCQCSAKFSIYHDTVKDIASPQCAN